jgi:hypothetical protein
MYKLTLNSFFGRDKNVPVLVGADGVSGPYTLNDRLPQIKGTAFDYIFRCLLNEPAAGDPPLEVDKGADFATYCWRYVDEKTSAETRRYADFYHKLLTRKIKIPELV